VAAAAAHQQGMRHSQAVALVVVVDKPRLGLTAQLIRAIKVVTEFYHLSMEQAAAVALVLSVKMLTLLTLILESVAPV
jgi:hypothetical protein